MTRLGDSKAVRKGGRYGRVMGTLWRHEKRDKCGRAAMGLLLDIWSWCADQSASVVSEKSMRKLFGGDPNGRRQLNELLAAGFVDRVEGGYAPHDWKDHSGFVKDLAEMEMKADLRCSRDEGVSGFVMNPGAEITEESTFPRACASPISQFSNSPIPEERESARAPVVPIQLANIAADLVPDNAQIPDDEEPRPLDRSSAEFAAARKLVRVEFSRRYQAAQGSGWTLGGSTCVDTIAGWLLTLQGPPAANLSKTLDNFFADPFCHSIHYLVSHLAKYPDKYHDPRKLPPKVIKVETVESLREQAREAVIAGDVAKVRSITARVAELQDAAERQNGGRRARA